jgi:ribosomal protein S4
LMILIPSIVAYSEATTSDMHRQSLMDRLIQELDVRTEAIQKIGNDLYELRAINTAQEKEIVQLKAKLETAEIKTTKLMNTFDLDAVSVDELKRRYDILFIMNYLFVGFYCECVVFVNC